jgi:hypothetical protein
LDEIANAHQISMNFSRVKVPRAVAGVTVREAPLSPYRDLAGIIAIK